MPGDTKEQRREVAKDGCEDEENEPPSPREKLRKKGRPLAFEGEEGGGGEGSEGGAKLNWVSCVGASPCNCTQKDSGTGMKRFSMTSLSWVLMAPRPTNARLPVKFLNTYAQFCRVTTSSKWCRETSGSQVDERGGGRDCRRGSNVPNQIQSFFG